MAITNTDPFTYAEALDLWSRIVAGWANSLDSSGARVLLDGIPNPEDAGGSYEGVTRMLWGLGSWLSRPERPAILRWRGASYDLEQLTRHALIGGTNPQSRGFWGNPPPRAEYDQRTVETGQVAFATWQSRARIWDQMSASERENLIAWLDRFGQMPAAWHSNWALFWVLNHAARKALGASHNQATIDSGLEYLEGVTSGGGWYDDAAKRGEQKFDDYNWWVFTTHELAWAACDGASQPRRRTLLLDRIQQRMAHYPYFFAADGAYAEYGRSLSYKFARLAAPLWAYQHGVWPHSVGMLRRLVGRHLRWYVDHGALRPDGTLRQSLTATGSNAVRESYISTGAVYWAMLAFAGLWALADDDPFWSVAEEPLPVEQASFVRAIPQPGWLLVGTQTSGAIQRFNAGSSGYYPAKYDKYLYATAGPFNVGLADGAPGPDSMLCLVYGEQLAHRTGTSAFAIGEPGWLRMRYVQQIGGGAHTIETIIVVRGELHVRVHRVTLDLQANGPIGALEGPAPLGYDTGDTPEIISNVAEGWESAAVHGRMVAIRRLFGYDGQRRAMAWCGRTDLNSVYGEYVLPLLSVTQLKPIHDLACLIYTGSISIEPATFTHLIPVITWADTGALHLAWPDSSTDTIPPL